MPKFQVSYMIEGKPDRQYLFFEHPASSVEDRRDVIRAIVKHEFPNKPDPFSVDESGELDKALRDNGLSDLRTPVRQDDYRDNA